MRIATFNCEWRKPSSPDAALIRERLLAEEADVIGLTEAYAEMFQGAGHTVSCGADYGYRMIPGRRKVLLWSRRPWTQVDLEGHADLPPGRFVAARTETSIGELAVIGVCVPWTSAHVTTGRRDRRPWEDHLAYLTALAQLLPAKATRTVIVGDFNQRVPRARQPRKAFDALAHTLVDFDWPTAGPISPIDRQTIDHIVTSRDLSAGEVRSISNLADDGHRISDHFGVSLQLSAR